MSLHHLPKRRRLESDRQMDLLGLPDEMLASVFKYTNFEESQKICKLNSRANEVFTRYNIRTLELNKIVFRLPSEIYFPQAEVEMIGRNNFNKFRRIVLQENAQNYLERLLEFIFKKVKSVEEFVVNCCYNGKLNLYEHALRKFGRFFGKRIKYFRTENVRLEFGTAVQLKQFLHNCKFEKLEVLFHRNNFIDYTLSDEIIDELDFQCLKWNYPSNITIKGLQGICERSLPENLEIHSKYFTIKGIAQVLEAVGRKVTNLVNQENDKAQEKYIKWIFHEVKHESMSRDEVKQMFKVSKYYKSVEVENDHLISTVPEVIMSLYLLPKRPRLECDHQMDLLTLPDEMLVSVFKYTNFEESQKICKLNRRIHDVFTKYNIRTLDLKYLNFSFYLQYKYSLNHANLDIIERNKVEYRKRILPKHGESPRDFLQRFLKFIFTKVKSIGELHIYLESKLELYFNQDELGNFSKLFKKRIKSFKTLGVVFQFGSQLQLKQFLSNCKFEELEVSCSDSVDQTLSDEMIDGLSFKSLIWCHLSDITPKGLHKMCDISLPENLGIHSKYITIKDIAQILEAFANNVASQFLEKSQWKNMEWKFHEMKNESMSPDKVEKMFDNSKLYKGVKVTEDRRTTSIKVILKTPRWRNGCSYRFRLKFCSY